MLLLHPPAQHSDGQPWTAVHAEPVSSPAGLLCGGHYCLAVCSEPGRAKMTSNDTDELRHLGTYMHVPSKELGTCQNSSLTSGKDSGWFGDEGRRLSRVSVSGCEPCSPGVWGGVGFLGDGLRLLSEVGVAGVRLTEV